MSRAVFWLTALFVALIPVGRSGLPLNAQWGDLAFVPLAAAGFLLPGTGDRRSMFRRSDCAIAAYLVATALSAFASADVGGGLHEVIKQAYGVAILFVFRRLRDDATLTSRLQKTLVISVALFAIASIVVVLARIPESIPLRRLGEVQQLPAIGLVPRLRGLL